MSTEMPRVLIALPLDTYLELVEHAAVKKLSISRQGRYLIEQALKFEGKPDYASALQGSE